MASVVKFLIGDGCLYLVTPQKGGLSRWSTPENWKYFFVTSKMSFDYNGSYTYRWHNNFHPYFYRCIDSSWPHLWFAKNILEPADVMVNYWSKPTLGRTWFEVEIKILLKRFIWRHFKTTTFALASKGLHSIVQMIQMILHTDQ